MKHIEVKPPEKPVTKPKVKTIDRVLTLITISIIGLYLALTFFLVSNWKNVWFAVRRPDIMEAARKVESEENRQIEEQIRATRQQTLKRIMAPTIINSATK